MSTIRINNNSTVNYTNLQNPNVQTGAGTAGDVGTSSAAVSSTKGKGASTSVNIFDDGARQTASAALIKLAQQSNSINLPASTQSAESDDSSDQSGDGSNWSSGIASLPQSLQGLNENQQSMINSAAANIASAVYSTPLSQLQAYNQQYSAAQSNTSSAPSISGVGSKLATASSGLSASGQVSGVGTGVTTQTAGLDANNNGVVTANQDAPTLQGAINQAATSYQQAASSGNYDQSVSAVSMMGVLGLQQQLGNYAQYVYGNQQNQNQMSTDNQELTQAIADWPADGSTQTFTWHEMNSSGQMTTQTGSLTLQQAQALQTTISDQLTSMSDQSQTDQLKLQSMAQQYQEGITTVSNMMSMQYNTLKNTLQNIHY